MASWLAVMVVFWRRSIVGVICGAGHSGMIAKMTCCVPIIITLS